MMDYENKARKHIQKTPKAVMLGIAAVVFSVMMLVFFVFIYPGIVVKVNPRDQVLITRFGKVQRVIQEPGLYWKTWFIDTAIWTDRRILDLDMPWFEITTSDKKRILVDVFARYKIADPLKHFTSVQNRENGENRLATYMQAALREIVGKHTFTDIVKNKRDDIMALIESNVKNKATALGISITDIKVKRTDLPEQNLQGVYNRMIAEREQEAAGIRAEGEEEKRKITSAADKEVVIIESAAKREAQKLIGEGEAERNRIFADAYGKHKQFFIFWRTMNAYEEALLNRDLPADLVLTTDAPFFEFFNKSLGSE